MYIAILGRQPELSVAELEVLYGGDNVHWLSDVAASVETDSFDFNRLGGSQKAGEVVLELGASRWPELSNKIIQHYHGKWKNIDHKITLGISV